MIVILRFSDLCASQETLRAHRVFIKKSVFAIFT